MRGVDRRTGSRRCSVQGKPSRRIDENRHREDIVSARCLVNQSSSCRRHPAALFGTAPAGGGAILAVLRLVLGAFVAACLAYLSANLAKRFRKLAAPRHIARSQSADLGTVHVERNAARHHLDVIFLQAGRRAHIAGVGAGITSFNTRLILLLHDVLLERFGISSSGHHPGGRRTCCTAQFCWLMTGLDGAGWIV